MSTLYRDTGYSLNHLIEDIRVGRIALPDIQRPFVWSSAKVRDLFDSMYRGYPVGTLMLWETGADVGVRRIGTDVAERAPQLLIVDGQQRLTSLYAVLTGSAVLTDTYEHRRIRVAFCPEREEFAVTDVAVERDPEFVPDVTALWGSSFKNVVREFLRRLNDARSEPLTDEEQDALEERIDRVRDLRDFRFQVVELNSSADEEQVADIFVRINSEGVKLNQADFILTLMSVHWEKGRQELESFSRAAVDPTIAGSTPRNPYFDPAPDQMLRVAVGFGFRRARLQHVYNLLRGKDLATGEMSEGFRTEQFALLATAQEQALDLTNWHEFLKCVQAAGFRSRKMISSVNALIYGYIMWLVGRHDFGLDLSSLRLPIARWFFMAHTMGRYTNSPESALEGDLGRIATIPDGDGEAFLSMLDRIVAANFTNDFWEISLPTRLDTSASRSPALFAYLAALNLLDADVLFSDVKMKDLLSPEFSAPRSMERHHLFPKKYLKDIGVTQPRQTNAIANMAFLDWAENAKISDAPPASYLPLMSSLVPADRFARQVEDHALPIGWEQLDYPTFLERRRDLIAGVIRRGFSTLWGDSPAPPTSTAEDLVAAGESQTVEFKSTARWNLKADMADPTMEHVIVKTVCGLLNAEGGSLLIGVDDDGTPLGLDLDLKTLGSKPNLDGYELFLRNLLERELSIPTAGTVRISFEHLENKDVCVVSVAASGKPVFAKPPKGTGGDARQFWVRVGNQTNQLHADDLLHYKDDHWG
jgi:hypothetical protein